MLFRTDFDDWQIEASDFITQGEGTIVLADIGEGKTVVVLDAINRIIQEDRPKGLPARALIVASRNIARNTWPQEVKNWAHLKHLTVAVAAGKDARGRLAACESGADITTINYESLWWLFGVYKKGWLPFDLIVFDESHRLKNPGTKMFKRLRHRIPEFRLRVPMTGSPSSEGIENLWSLQFVATEGEAFENYTYTDFIKEKFAYGDRQGYSVIARPGTAKWIYDRIGDHVFRHAGKSTGRELRVQDIYVDLPKDVMARYRKLEKEYILMFHDEDGKLVTVDAVSAAAKQQKLRQICAGFSYYLQKEGDPKSRAIAWHGEHKLKTLQDLRGELWGKQLLTVYGFTAEWQQVRKMEGVMTPVLGGSTKAQDADRWIEEWNEGKIKHMMVHPRSAGEGLNLHYGGAHHMAFLTLPWSRNQYDQVIGRLKRKGQKKTVYAHRIIAKGTVDELVVDALEHKGNVEQAVLRALQERHDARRARS